MKPTTVDAYLTDGCGRCPLGGTPDCKVHKWAAELALLRRIVLDCGLTEAVKWGVPCYTFQEANVLIVSAFNDYCCVSFFKGALLQDNKGILEKPGENSQAARLLKFTNVREVKKHEPDLKNYIFEAIEVEKAGLNVDFKAKNELVLVEELQKKLAKDPALKTAFEALTPGRQRGYNLYFSAAKQAQTREARIEKYLEKILAGKGFHDR